MAIMKFSTYEKEYDQLNEVLITFGKKAYPKFGNVVILAGGAGSGKGFVKANLLGIEGFSFDVDELKKLALKAPGLKKLVKKELDLDMDKMNSKNPKDVSKLHYLISDYLRLDKTKRSSLYNSIFTADPRRKPNLIFDVTLARLGKLEELSHAVQELGYDKKNIHLVWVINDIEIAKKQNLQRSRTVDTDILVNTHRGASQSMADIVKMGNRIKKWLDGDVVFAFSRIKVDDTETGAADIPLAKSDKGGQYVLKGAKFFYIKKAGKPPMKLDMIQKSVRAKIASYVPKNVRWL